jgi:hypothetical protein
MFFVLSETSGHMGRQRMYTLDEKRKITRPTQIATRHNAPVPGRQIVQGHNAAAFFIQISSKL